MNTTTMTSNLKISLLLLLGLSISAHADAGENNTRAIGNAYDLKSDEFLYREIHCGNDDPDEVEVIYRNEADRVIARKQLDYGSGSVSPSFVQHNLYSSEIIEVALDDGEVRMAVRDAVTDTAKTTVSEPAGNSTPVVIDAGFDEYVRRNWDDLVSGEKISFRFPFAERASLVELRLKRAGCSYETSSDQCFKLELSNWFLRMLVAPIELGYDPEQQRLMRYRGLSNIGDGKGNGSVVDIRYHYQDLPALACQNDTPVVQES